MPATETTTPEKLGLSIEEAAETLGVGRDRLIGLTKRADDPVPTIRFGRRVVIPSRPFADWVDAELARQRS